MEIQHAGYLTLEAKAQLDGTFPPWIVTNWGSDIYLFGRLPEHKEKIRKVLSNCDYYACECHRDVDLAQAFGFRGEVLPVLPNGGGYSVEQLRKFRQEGPTSLRRLIALKGYQNWAGRALVALRALELCGDALEGYRVQVYLANDEVRLAAELLSQATGIPIEVMPPGSTHEEILRLHGHARISIGLSISDAISTSALEAITMGAFPIQSHTSCLNEWVCDGETGLLVHPESPEEIAAAIRRAIKDDALVDHAAEANYRVAIERLDKSVIQPQVVSYYRRIAGRA
jgi:glycosyltransferase involved in cell wall biosynthesis